MRFDPPLCIKRQEDIDHSTIQSRRFTNHEHYEYNHEYIYDHHGDCADCQLPCLYGACPAQTGGRAVGSLPDAESTRIEDKSQAEPDPSLSRTEESSLQDPTPAEQFSSFAGTYEIVTQSSKRSRPKLIDNQDYSYSIQIQRGVVTDWQCSVRPKLNPCLATVRQRGDQHGNHVYNNQAQVGALMSTKITSHVDIALSRLPVITSTLH